MRLNSLVIFVFAFAAALGSGTPSEARGGGGGRTRISGRVVHENGEIIAGATVELAGNGETIFVKTDRNGTFFFGKLDPGSYTVTAFVIVFSPPPGVFAIGFMGSEDVELGAGDRPNLLIVVHPVG